MLLFLLPCFYCIPNKRVHILALHRVIVLMLSVALCDTLWCIVEYFLYLCTIRDSDYRQPLNFTSLSSTNFSSNRRCCSQSFEHGLKALDSIPVEGWVQLVALKLGLEVIFSDCWIGFFGSRGTKDCQIIAIYCIMFLNIPYYLIIIYNQLYYIRVCICI